MADVGIIRNNNECAVFPLSPSAIEHESEHTASGIDNESTLINVSLVTKIAFKLDRVNVAQNRTFQAVST